MVEGGVVEEGVWWRGVAGDTQTFELYRGAGGVDMLSTTEIEGAKMYRAGGIERTKM